MGERLHQFFQMFQPASPRLRQDHRRPVGKWWPRLREPLGFMGLQDLWWVETLPRVSLDSLNPPLPLRPLLEAAPESLLYPHA